MTLFQALILGMIQGLAEFFPISSSAHLTLARYLMGIQHHEGFVYFDLVCHSGTLLALLIYLRSDIQAVLKNKKTIALLILATLPLIPAYLLLKPLRIALADPFYLSYFLIVTSLFLFIASIKQPANSDSSRPKWKSVLCIGLVQTMAFLPGISRSGSTIAAGRLLGWDWLSSARFSFLLAIPTILGGQFLETLKIIKSGPTVFNTLPLNCYLSGFTASFAIGLLGARFVFWIYKLGYVRPFAWYCLSLGIITWLGFHG